MTAELSRNRAMLIVGLCFAINMVDGMDVNILSYVRAALSSDWGIADDVMGYVMSAGTFGMGIGALGIAPLADRYGRKLVIMAALALMSAGMVASGVVSSIDALMASRLVVGMGIGTVLATMAALAAETAPEGKKDLAVALVQAGFPLAAVGTGFATAALLPAFGWQGLLFWAGVVTVAMLPLAWFILPAHLPGAEVGNLSSRSAMAKLLTGSQRTRTVLLMIAVFMGLLTLYSMLSWITKLATAAGLSDQDSIYAGALYNFGAFFGTACMGMLTLRIRPSILVPVLLLSACVVLLIFGNATMSAGWALFMAFLIGLTLQGGYNGVWPLAAGAFETETRATGIGWVMGVGRGGAVVGPIMAGYLLQAKLSLAAILAVYCVPLAICALCAFLVGRASR